MDLRSHSCTHKSFFKGRCLYYIQERASPAKFVCQTATKGKVAVFLGVCAFALKWQPELLLCPLGGGLELP